MPKVLNIYTYPLDILCTSHYY